MFDRLNEELVTAPVGSVLTLDEVKLHCRITTGTSEDALLTALIASATEWTQRYLRRALIRQTWEQRADYWPASGVFLLNWLPVASITSLVYLDQSGATQTVDAGSYQLIRSSEMTHALVLAYNYARPALNPSPGSIRIRYVAGYAPSSSSPPDPAANIPAAIKHAMLMQVAELYENRETSIVGTIIAENPAWLNLLQPFRTLEV